MASRFLYIQADSHRGMPLATCPNAMPPPSLSAHILNRALALVGSEKKLAYRLRVPSAELRTWLAGQEVPPFPVFLEAVDIILSAQEEALPFGPMPSVETGERAPGGGRLSAGSGL
jgi:hypothetical protein